MADWIQTYSGLRFYPLAPRVEDVRLVDIAHALSMKCRFGGHVKEFYSVAQHSVMLSRHVQLPKFKIWALLHDAGEAYLPDVCSPIKHGLGWPKMSFSDAEDFIIHTVLERFGMRLSGFSSEVLTKIQEIDTRICLNEGEELMAGGSMSWKLRKTHEPLNLKPWQPWSPHTAEQEFLFEARELGIKEPT